MADIKNQQVKIPICKICKEAYFIILDCIEHYDRQSICKSEKCLISTKYNRRDLIKKQGCTFYRKFTTEELYFFKITHERVMELLKLDCIREECFKKNPEFKQKIRKNLLNKVEKNF